MPRSMFSRACGTAASVFSMDPTLVRAFEQIDTDARIERARGSRWAVWRAWPALARTLWFGVPAAMFARLLALNATARSGVLLIFAGQVAWVTIPHGVAWFLVTRPGFDILAPWVYLISNAAGVQVVQRTALPHRAGALAALVFMTTAFWAAALLMEVTIAVDTLPGSATLLMRGLLLPLMAAQVIWLSALATMAGRRTALSLTQAVPLGIGYALLVYVVAPGASAHLMTPAVVMVLVPITFAVTVGVSAWIVRGPRHA